MSEISEIAILSANEVGSEIIGIVEPNFNKKNIQYSRFKKNTSKFNE